MFSGGFSECEKLPPIVEIDHYRPRWYVIHTRSRHEKRVNEQLQVKQVEVFLPLYRSKRNWNGRSAVVDLPLFPGYVFVRIPLAERLSVLSLGGVAGLVSFQGAPVPLPDLELERMRTCLSWAAAEPVPYFRPGNRVRIVEGALAGLEGVILRQNGQARFVLSIDLILRSVAVNVDARDLELVEPATESDGPRILGVA
jgi:transcription elongation factor/antiterminator RfaH